MEELSFVRKSWLVLLAVIVWFGALFALITISGCVSTPEPVVQANTMAVQTLGIYEQNVNMVIDALVTENVAQNERRYMEQLNKVLPQIINPDGTTDLVRYLELKAAYQKEIDVGTAYYLTKGEELKAKLAAQMRAARTLLDANTAWLEAAGIPPEQFEEIVNNLFAVGTVTLESRAAADARGREADAQRQLQMRERIDNLPDEVARIRDLIQRIRAELPEQPEGTTTLQDMLNQLRSQ